MPIAGGEQMYQALKSLGVETQLVDLPGQFHGLTIPSYERDRLQRYSRLVRQIPDSSRQRHGAAAVAAAWRRRFWADCYGE